MYFDDEERGSSSLLMIKKEKRYWNPISQQDPVFTIDHNDTRNATNKKNKVIGITLIASLCHTDKYGNINITILQRVKNRFKIRIEI